MKTLHSLLRRQLKKLFGEDFSPPSEWRAFIEAVDDAYHGFDEDRLLLERSLELSSRELFEEKERIRQYLDIAGAIILVLDANGCITLINRKGCEILGYESADIVGKNWFEQFIPEKHRAETEAMFRSLLNGNLAETKHMEGFVLTRDGKERVIAWANNVIADEAGSIQGTLSSGEDITERKHAERELEEQMRQVNKLNEFMLGREKRIVEMKQEINALLSELHRKTKYSI